MTKKLTPTQQEGLNGMLTIGGTLLGISLTAFFTFSIAYGFPAWIVAIFSAIVVAMPYIMIGVLTTITALLAVAIVLGTIVFVNYAGMYFNKGKE